MTPDATPLRDDIGTTPPTRSCPVCGRPFTPIRRQVYCGTPCRKTAFRRRHTATPAARIPAGDPKREHTVYECAECGQRQLGEQRCPDCAVFGRAVGLGGTCPHCSEPITLDDLDLTTQPH